jgi:integrase
MRPIYTERPVDCKSSIVSSILTRASTFLQGKKEINSGSQIYNFEFLINFLPQLVDIVVNLSSQKVSLKFIHKQEQFRIPLNCSLTELTESDVKRIVTKKIQELNNVITLEFLLAWILDCNNRCGGNLDTRKKNVSHIIDLCGREGISLQESTHYLLTEDDEGRTLPERWEEIYNLPHKLRQIKSLFSRKNLLLFKRRGWETKHFGNFVSFIAQSVVSQPFSTDDSEVERIIEFFQGKKESDPVFYDIYLLAFGCGLRKSEIYQVHSDNFKIFNGQHFLFLPFATKGTKLRGTGHVEKVGISQQVFLHFQSREGKIINGGERLHKRFIKFLKTDLGLTDVKSCHRLRKILGARLASTHGIFHASKTLRNSVAVCEKYYSDLTTHKNELVV